MTIHAPAKVNLFLEALERRPDGYHAIRSVLAPVSVFDVVTLEHRDGDIETTLDPNGAIGADLLPDAASPENLAARAARALKEETGWSGGARIHVVKNIPVGGGLGGGSADAAAVLVGLDTLWNTGLSRERLMDVGARLGSDIPALIHGGWVVMEGRGERVTPLETDGARTRPRPWLVLANPGFHVSTRDVYRRYTALTLSGTPFNNVLSVLKKGNVSEMAQAVFNSLQSCVFEKYPMTEMTAEGLADAGALGVLLCGSGATVMGLARDRDHARDIEQTVRARLDFPVWSQVAQLLPDGVMVAHGPLEARV